jgi:hypothetical protein
MVSSICQCNCTLRLPGNIRVPRLRATGSPVESPVTKNQDEQHRIKSGSSGQSRDSGEPERFQFIISFIERKLHFSPNHHR